LVNVIRKVNELDADVVVVTGDFAVCAFGVVMGGGRGEDVLIHPSLVRPFSGCVT